MNTPRLAHYQQDAVERLLATMGRNGGALLADEPGLGKSWVAASVASEWVGSASFIVPAPLVNQWRELLRDFQVAGTVQSHDALLARPFPEGGLIVVDEAHRFRNPATRRYRALAIGVLGRALLLVTATPVANRAQDLLSLFRLFAADDLLRADGVPSLDLAFAAAKGEQIAQALRLLVVRRDRSVVPESLRFGTLERRLVPTPAGAVDGEIFGAIEQLEFPLIARGGELRPLRALLRRRFESSEAALAATMRRQRRFFRRAREALLEGCTVTKRDVLRLFGAGDEDLPFQDLLFKPLWFQRGDPAAADFEAVDRELGRIEVVLQLLVSHGSPKADTLLKLLAQIALPAIVFTVSAATARDLHRRCSRVMKSALVTSGSSRIGSTRASREAVFDALDRGDLEVMIATDVGGEGLNLQGAASVVHYDLPWNPVRIEQRDGRAWRIGQARPIVGSLIFIPRAARRDQVLSTVLRKNRVRRRVLEGGLCRRDPSTTPEAALARAVLPPRLSHPADRMRWKKSLQSAGAYDSTWEGILASSHPAGVDLWLSMHAARAAEMIEQARELLARLRAVSGGGPSL